MIRKSLLTTLVAAMMLVMAPGAAHATWGPYNNCYRSVNEDHHCYSIEIFTMSGYPREYSVGGAIFTYWGGGYIAYPIDFADNEQWVSFTGSENYIECGSTLEQSSSLRMFFASTRNGSQWAYIAPGQLWLGTWNPCQIYDPNKNGEWRIYFSGFGNQQGSWVKTDYGYPWWAKELNAGEEIGANHKPIDAGGKDMVASVEPQNCPSNCQWTAYMSGYGNHSYPYHSAGMCIARNPESPYWGNLTFSPGCAPGSSEATPPPEEGTTAAQGEAQINYSGLSGAPKYTAAKATAKAIAYAKQAGDGEPEVIRTAQGSFSNMQANVEPSSTFGGSQVPWQEAGSYLFEYKARAGRTFHMRGVSVPYGHKAVSGPYMALIVDSHTGIFTGRYVGANPPGEEEPKTEGAVAARLLPGGLIRGRLYSGASRPGHASRRAEAGRKIDLRRSLTGPVITWTKSHAGGHFQIPARPGWWYVGGDGCFHKPVRVHVIRHQTTKVQLTCGK